jgi:hypothetical protein
MCIIVQHIVQQLTLPFLIQIAMFGVGGKQAKHVPGVLVVHSCFLVPRRSPIRLCVRLCVISDRVYLFFGTFHPEDL